MSKHQEWDSHDHFIMDGLTPAKLTDTYVTDELPSAGIDAIHKSVVGSNTEFPEAIREIKKLQSAIESWPDVRQVRSADDLCEGEGLDIVFGFQGTTPIGRDLDNVRLFHQLGVRIIQLTYNYRNFCGDGCTESTDAGLSRFGEELIDTLESHGILLDLSHAGERTAIEALSIASQPTIISHANSKALCEHPRNISDKLATEVVESGGLIGVNAFPAFLGENPTVKDLVDHMEYFGQLVGFEHVALGLDLLDNIDYTDLEMLAKDPTYPDEAVYPDGIEQATDIPNIAVELVERGYSTDVVSGVMGENLRRVYRSVW